MNTLVYEGKSKDVYKRDDGYIEFHFKDAATGIVIDGKTIFDPGRDNVVGEIKGKGAVSCKFTTFFFKKLAENGIPNHYIDTRGDRVIVAREAQLPRIKGLYNLEFVYRNNAQGSFLRRYAFVPECVNLNGLIEITTKGQTDHLINDEALTTLGILTEDELKEAKEITRRVFAIIETELQKKGLHLIDGKIEIGRLDGRMAVIDDISPDVMRVCRESDLNREGCRVQCRQSHVLDPLEIYRIMLGS
ncbi:MAG: phosphoribosylaminoimidazolesuccinocarboxamide synthase [Candidatus Aminicenantales bacterium]